MAVPILGRLNLRDYQALFIGWLLLFVEAILRLVTFCLPLPVLEICKTESQRIFSKFYKDERTDPVKKLQKANNFSEMAEFWEYPSEEHVVKTQDNYMLGVHRIPRGRSTPRSEGSPSIESIFKKRGIPVSAIRGTISGKTSDVRPVVLLYHGLMMCSEVWLCNLEDENRMATLLADAGYDVWFGNARGNKYSMKHTQYSPNGTQFWNYCIDEFAMCDLPSLVDYILETTGAPSLTYIGFSQGTATAFAALSVSPQLNKKVNLFIALAPATSPRGLHNIFVDAIIKASPNIVYLLFGRKACLAVVLFWQKVLAPPIFTKILDLAMSFLFGWKLDLITEAQKAVSYYHLYSCASTKSLVHWFQIIRARNFQVYDELPAYSSYTSLGYCPSRFPTQQIATPIAVFYGGSDSLVDINVLTRQLPKCVLLKEVKKYEHIDFIWAADVHKHVFPELFDLLRVYNVDGAERDDIDVDADYDRVYDPIMTKN
ncbi:8417_t:CDS:2 [Paraglomus occultum]|uniref:8417_t:CDS:1 n=1 Tax=Paraglomus occultum TaxID=144539 RepID=A0A9N8WLH9_9GLOM|nr:8417_t:CDS:2 [Paraglomus occultum]